MVGSFVGTYFGVKVGLGGRDRIKRVVDGKGDGRER